MPLKDDQQPTGSVPRRLIAKLRAMQEEMDEIIEYLVRQDAIHSGSSVVALVEHSVTDEWSTADRIEHVMLPWLKEHGPATREEMYKVLKQKGFKFKSTNMGARLGNIQTSMSMLENSGSVRKLDPQKQMGSAYHGRYEAI